MVRRARFAPISSELGSYVKTFLIIWFIVGAIIWFLEGGGYWAFWSGISVGFIITIPIYYILCKATGVREQ